MMKEVTIQFSSFQELSDEAVLAICKRFGSVTLSSKIVVFRYLGVRLVCDKGNVTTTVYHKDRHANTVRDGELRDGSLNRTEQDTSDDVDFTSADDKGSDIVKENRQELDASSNCTEFVNPNNMGLVSSTDTEHVSSNTMTRVHSNDVDKRIYADSRDEILKENEHNHLEDLDAMEPVTNENLGELIYVENRDYSLKEYNEENNAHSKTWHEERAHSDDVVEIFHDNEVDTETEMENGSCANTNTLRSMDRDGCTANIVPATSNRVPDITSGYAIGTTSTQHQVASENRKRNIETTPGSEYGASANGHDFRDTSGEKTGVTRAEEEFDSKRIGQREQLWKKFQSKFRQSFSRKSKSHYLSKLHEDDLNTLNECVVNSVNPSQSNNHSANSESVTVKFDPEITLLVQTTPKKGKTSSKHTLYMTKLRPSLRRKLRQSERSKSNECEANNRESSGIPCIQNAMKRGGFGRQLYMPRQSEDFAKHPMDQAITERLEQLKKRKTFKLTQLLSCTRT